MSYSLWTKLLAWLGFAHLCVWCSTGAKAADEISPSFELVAFPELELQVLNDLYISTNGQNWRWGYNGTVWNFTASANPCTDNWQGIICANNSNIIYGLLLPAQNLVGTIPPSIALLSNLSTLNLGQNHVNGTIPPEIGNMSNLFNLNLYANDLTGTIPNTLGQLHHLHTLYLYNNRLSGTIPPAVWQLQFVEALLVSHNHLSGTIPANIDIAPLVQYFFLNGNNFEGPIPASIGALRRPVVIWWYDNAFTGTLPNSICNWTTVLDISISNNLLHGALPDNLGDLILLEKLTMANNLFSGTIPRSLNALPFLITLELSGNKMEGNLDGLFDAQLQRALKNIEIDNNALTGTLPSEMFLLPSLESFIAVSNCFDGRLPVTVCQASQAVSLVMDGLSSAPACRHTLFQGLSSTYSIVNSVGGPLPTCIFELPLLSTLHLSGNDFTGGLPNDVVLSPQLVDLSLSHNVLTGSIPAQFQQRRWIVLDLSYNRLSGILHGDFGTDTAYPGRSQAFSKPAFALLNNESDFSLSLQTNRISGKIPGTLHGLRNITILGTNVFSCDLGGVDLPEHDNGRNNYQCGSNSFDVTYFVWLGLAAVCVLCSVVWAIHMRQGRMEQYYAHMTEIANNIRSWYTVYAAAVDAPSAISVVFAITNALSRIALYCAVFIVVVLLPVYCVVSSYYDTFTYQYAWTTSAVFMSGVTPLILLLVLWVALLTLLLSGAHFHLFSIKPITRRAISVYLQGLRTYSMSRLPIICIYGAYIFINITVVVGVNIAYVYVAVYEDAQLFVAAQVLLSFFKILWNNKVTYYVLDRTVQYFQPADQNLREQDFVSLQLFVTLQNNIILPCLVVACISKSCFHDLFVAAPTVKSVVLLNECAAFAPNGKCRATVSVLTDTVFKPPFRYSYQCSSSLVTYYSPAFVNLCIVGTFVSPVAQAVGLRLYARAQEGTWWYAVLNYNLPSILKPISGAPDRTPGKRFFRPNVILNSLVTYLALMMTFGAVFPPLAVSLLITMIASAVYGKIKVGRFLQMARDQDQYAAYFAVLESECAAVETSVLMHSSVWMLVTLSCWFYTLFLFDTLGDAVGFDGTYWVLIVMPMMPLSMYFVYSCSLYLLKGARGKANHDIELTAAPLDFSEKDQNARGSEIHGEVINAILLK